jgi:hypothetical protein
MINANTMERKRNTLQVYAMLVNVVSVIAFLIALTGFISAIIDRQTPLLVTMYSQVDLSSFEKYKLDVTKGIGETSSYIPTDDELKSMYEAARQEKIDRVLHNSFKSLLISSTVILISIVLFVIHWIILWREKKLSLD